ncbi:MAG: hypothetical protein Hals2KO_29820 [Halioglobus sp.]
MRSVNAYSTPNSNRGLSLVEFMVAMLLGTVLIGGAVSIYLASQRSYVEAERSMVMGDNGRFASMLLTESLRHAGFVAGIRGTDVDDDTALDAVTGTDCAGAAAAYDLRTTIFAATVDASGNAITCITDGVPGTDVLVLKSLLPFPVYDVDPNDPSATPDGQFSFPDPSGLQSDTTYVVANSQRGLLIDGAEPVAAQPNVLDGQPWARALAWPYQYQVFYVGDPNQPGRSAPTLSRKVLSFDTSTSSMAIQTEDLVEGIEHMRLRFGMDTNGDGEIDRYGNITDVTAQADWASITSIEAFLLARSLDEDFTYTDEKTYQLGDLTVDPNEPQFPRRLVRAGISLRNPQIFLSGGY